MRITAEIRLFFRPNWPSDLDDIGVIDHSYLIIYYFLMGCCLYPGEWRTGGMPADYIEPSRTVPVLW